MHPVLHVCPQAFYMPWEELPRWSQVHLAEYSKAKILALIGEPTLGFEFQTTDHHCFPILRSRGAPVCHYVVSSGDKYPKVVIAAGST